MHCKMDDNLEKQIYRHHSNRLYYKTYWTEKLTMLCNSKKKKCINVKSKNYRNDYMHLIGTIQQNTVTAKKQRPFLKWYGLMFDRFPKMVGYKILHTTFLQRDTDGSLKSLPSLSVEHKCCYCYIIIL